MKVTVEIDSVDHGFGEDSDDNTYDVLASMNFTYDGCFPIINGRHDSYDYYDVEKLVIARNELTNIIERAMQDRGATLGYVQSDPSSLSSIDED